MRQLVHGNGNSNPVTPAHGAPPPTATIPALPPVLSSTPAAADGTTSTRPNCIVLASSSTPGPLPANAAIANEPSSTNTSPSTSSVMSIGRSNASVSVAATPCAYTADTSVSAANVVAGGVRRGRPRCL